jgi:hypothetical protein
MAGSGPLDQFWVCGCGDGYVLDPCGLFRDLQDHLLLYFRLVAWGLLAWIK